MVGDVNKLPVLKREISSGATLLYKFLIPFLFISIFGTVTLAIFCAAPGKTQIKAPEIGAKWQFLAGWLAFSAFLWWSGARLKKVCVGTDAIYVSNFRKEIRIPFEEVIEVTENRWLNIRPITIHFRHATAFGRRIVFMPMLHGWKVFEPHAIVGDLKALARLSNT